MVFNQEFILELLFIVNWIRYRIYNLQVLVKVVFLHIIIRFLLNQKDKKVLWNVTFCIKAIHILNTRVWHITYKIWTNYKTFSTPFFTEINRYALVSLSKDTINHYFRMRVHRPEYSEIRFQPPLNGFTIVFLNI